MPELAGLDSRAIHAPWTASSEALAAAGVTLGADYPHRVVDHAVARTRARAAYAASADVDPEAGSDTRSD